MIHRERFEDLDLFKIQPGRLGWYFGKVYAYGLDGVLINSGPRSEANRFLELLRPKRPDLIVNSCSQAELCGANGVIQQAFSIPAFAHKRALGKIRYPEEQSLKQRWIWGPAAPSKVRRVGQTLASGESLFVIQETEGFAPGHICLFEKKRGWLFTGDLLSGQPPADEAAFATDLSRLLKLDPTLVFCARNGVKERPAEIIAARLHALDTGQE